MFLINECLLQCCLLLTHHHNGMTYSQFMKAFTFVVSFLEESPFRQEEMFYAFVSLTSQQWLWWPLSPWVEFFWFVCGYWLKVIIVKKLCCPWRESLCGPKKVKHIHLQMFRSWDVTWQIDGDQSIVLSLIFNHGRTKKNISLPYDFCPLGDN